MNQQVLLQENECFRGRGGVSAENQGAGFRPAFMDTESQRVFPSCFADGRPAPFHLLDGLPEDVVTARHAGGGVAQIKLSVVSGFVRDGRFYSREEAAACVATLH